MKYLIDGRSVIVTIKHRNFTTQSDWYAVYKDELGQSKYLTSAFTWEIWSHKTKAHIYWKSYEEIEKILDKLYKRLDIMDFDLGV